MKRRKLQHTIELVNDGQAFVVPGDDILFMEKQKHGTLVKLSAKSPLHATGENLVSREKFSDLSFQLADEGFAIPHSSYLVNIKIIISVSNECLVLEDDTSISISRRCKESFHQEFSKFFKKKYRRR